MADAKAEPATVRTRLAAELDARRRVGDDLATLLIGLVDCSPDMPCSRRLAEDLVAKWRAIKAEG